MKELIIERHPVRISVLLEEFPPARDVEIHEVKAYPDMEKLLYGVALKAVGSAVPIETPTKE